MHEGCNVTRDGEFVQLRSGIGKDAETSGGRDHSLGRLEAVSLYESLLHGAGEMHAARLGNFAGEIFDVAKFVPGVDGNGGVEVVEEDFGFHFGDFVRVGNEALGNGSHVGDVELVRLAVLLALEIALAHLGDGGLEVVAIVSDSASHKLDFGVVGKRISHDVLSLKIVAQVNRRRSPSVFSIFPCAFKD